MWCDCVLFWLLPMLRRQYGLGGAFLHGCAWLCILGCQYVEALLGECFQGWVDGIGWRWMMGFFEGGYGYNIFVVCMRALERYYGT